MAKLEGVKTLDTVNGEITKVEYNGEVYEKVDTPKKGDIGLFSKDSWVAQINPGLNFTEIINVRNSGNSVDVCKEHGDAWFSEFLTYFRKPSAPSLKVGDKVRLISVKPKYGFGFVRVGDVGEVRSINGDDVVVDFPNHTYWNGLISEIELAEEEAQPAELFAKVNRPNNVPIPGDYVEFRDSVAKRYSSFLTVGKKYFVKGVDEHGDADITDDNGVPETADTDEIKAIYVKYTQEQEEREPKVGDKILVVDAYTPLNTYENGDIFKVKTGRDEGDYIRVEEHGTGMFDYEYIVLNPEQVGEEQFEVISNPETIEKGDLVQVIDSPSALPNGSYFVVKGVSEDGSILRGVRPDSYFDTDYMYATRHVKLIAKAGKGEGDRFYG